VGRKTKSAGGVKNVREISAGGLIWRRKASGDFEVVLVRPAGKDAWCLPKGLIEKGESVKDAAVRECREETGFTVSVGEPLGEVSYIYSRRPEAAGPLLRIFKKVYFFLMKFEGGDSAAHDREIEEVAWLGPDEAERRASYKSERELIVKARSILR